MAAAQYDWSGGCPRDHDGVTGFSGVEPRPHQPHGGQPGSIMPDWTCHRFLSDRMMWQRSS